jgi:Family of unknown function (DUF6228)
MDRIRIKADQGRAWLELTRLAAVQGGRQEDSVTATLVHEGLEARTEVYIPPGNGLDGLDSLFVTMADQWRGWADEKSWGSLEGELSLSCTHDGLGHVKMAVELQRDVLHDSWRARAVFVVWAGSLERIARGLSKFAGSVPG